MNDQWITVRQACELLDCHESTLRIYIRKGLIRKWQATPSEGKKRGSKPWLYAYDVDALLPRLPLPVGHPKGKKNRVDGGAGRNHVGGKSKHTPA